MIPARKNCAHCGRWLYSFLNFYVAERDDDGNPVRVGSWCKQCNREAVRVRNGRRRRGARYNPQRKLTPEQSRKRRNDRHKRRKTAQRKGDPLVPLWPLAAWLKERVAESNKRRIALRADIDDSELERLLNQVVINGKTGRIERQMDIYLSKVERILIRFEEPLLSVYPDDLFPWLYEGRRPRKRPRKARRAA